MVRALFYPLQLQQQQRQISQQRNGVGQQNVQLNGVQNLRQSNMAQERHLGRDNGQSNVHVTPKELPRIVPPLLGQSNQIPQRLSQNDNIQPQLGQDSMVRQGGQVNVAEQEFGQQIPQQSNENNPQQSDLNQQVGHDNIIPRGQLDPNSQQVGQVNLHKQQVGQNFIPQMPPQLGQDSPVQQKIGQNNFAPQLGQQNLGQANPVPQQLGQVAPVGNKASPQVQQVQI